MNENISFQARMKENQKDFQAVIVDFRRSLRKHGVKSLKVIYSGSGDSGAIDDVEINPPNVESNIHVDNYEQWDNVKMEITNFSGDVDLTLYIEEFFEAYLRTFHGGWEDNEGQSGYFEWDSESELPYINHSFNYPITKWEEEKF